MYNFKVSQKTISAVILSFLASIGATILTPVVILLSLFFGFGYLVQAQPVISRLVILIFIIVFVFGSGITVNLWLTKNLDQRNRVLALGLYVVILIVIIGLFFLLQPNNIGGIFAPQGL